MQNEIVAFIEDRETLCPYAPAHTGKGGLSSLNVVLSLKPIEAMGEDLFGRDCILKYEAPDLGG
jgi:hypothetical protein